MDDLISRAYVLAEYDRQHKGPPGGARKIMAEAPAVDAVPVVRCRDCKYYHGINEGCGCNSFYPSGDWFCADGKRRNGDA